MISKDKQFSFDYLSDDQSAERPSEKSRFTFQFESILACVWHFNISKLKINDIRENFEIKTRQKCTIITTIVYIYIYIYIYIYNFRGVSE